MVRPTVNKRAKAQIFALGVIGVAAAGFTLPASAAITTYNLLSGGCSTNNTNYNNARSCTGVTATGWSNTGNPLTTGTQLDSARVVAYGSGLGTTNKDGPGGSGDGLDANEQDSDAPEHAIDNDQRKDSMRLTFGTSVKLTDVQLGYVSGDSDLTILAFTGGACNGGVAGQTYVGLTSCGWTLVSHIMNVPQQSGTSFTSINNTTSISSQYWLISTYISDLANAGKTVGTADSSKDHVKLLAVKGDPNGKVPEPGTAALLGIGALGFWRLRRKA
jgi:PEP-CTERM motif